MRRWRSSPSGSVKRHGPMRRSTRTGWFLAIFAGSGVKLVASEMVAITAPSTVRAVSATSWAGRGHPRAARSTWVRPHLRTRRLPDHRRAVGHGDPDVATQFQLVSSRNRSLSMWRAAGCFRSLILIKHFRRAPRRGAAMPLRFRRDRGDMRCSPGWCGGRGSIALIAFLGGLLSAGNGMVIVESVALAIMNSTIW